MIVKRVSDLVQGRQIHSIRYDQTVETACAIMARENIGALIVTRDGQMCGIVTERDVIRRWVSMGLVGEDTWVKDIMTADPVCLGGEDSLAMALNTMRDGGFRHLPITNGAGDVTGVVSMRDIPVEYRVMVDRFASYQRYQYAAQ